MVFEALGSMLINGVVSQRKHRRNGINWIANTRPSFLSTNFVCHQEAAQEDLPDATLEGLRGAVLSPGTAQLILQSTYMISVQQITLSTFIR
jgi:hypothetical protein